jgi:hypothetical protein
MRPERSGTCKKAITLANLTNVILRDIHVTGYEGSFLMQTNVQGVGLELGNKFR